MLTPFLAVWCIHVQHFSPGGAASLVGLYVIMSRSGALIFANLLVRYAAKVILAVMLFLLTMLLVVLYFFGAVHITNYVYWLLTVIALACALSISAVMILSYQNKINLDIKKEIFYIYLNIAVNLSTGFSPFLGAIILHHYPQLLPLAPAVFTIIAFVICLSLPTKRVPEITPQAYPKLGNLLKNNNLIKFTIVSSLTFVGYACFYDVFVLYVHQSISLPVIGLLFAYNSLLIVLLQIPLQKFIQKFSTHNALMIANILISLSVLLLFFGKNILLIAILGVSALCITEMIAWPMYNTQILYLAGAENGTHAFALSTATRGFIEGMAAFIGTYLIAHGHASIFYILSCGVCVLVALYFKFGGLKLKT